MLDSLSKKQKIIFFIILFIMLLIIIYYIYSVIYCTDSQIYITDDLLLENNTNTYSNLNSNNLEDDFIIVYICGAVKENKIVKLKENSRINDAIEAVGGLTKNADLTNINLAYILEDGEKIYVPEKGELTQENSKSSSFDSTSSFSSSSNSLKNNKININKATQTELETIPGIGPSLALKIINYREENGKFSSIEEIKKVSGIGDSKYNQIKDFIIIK